MRADPVYKEITAQSALNKLKRKIPYGWDLNIYRGCGHGCRYCYAMYSHDYLDGEKDFHRDIFVKTNIVEQLEKELKSESWNREVINIGGVTDSYQPAESRYRLMPEILKLLIKYKTPAIISTKSDLVLRDYELIDELSQITYINIAATITTVDETIARKIEPGSASPSDRFKVLKESRVCITNIYGLNFTINGGSKLSLLSTVKYASKGERGILWGFFSGRCGSDSCL